MAVYISQVLEGLVYLHDQGVIHRDIKGANILTNKDGCVKLADFGVASTTAGAITDDAVVGSPYWSKWWQAVFRTILKAVGQWLRRSSNSLVQRQPRISGEIISCTSNTHILYLAGASAARQLSFSRASPHTTSSAQCPLCSA